MAKIAYLVVQCGCGHMMRTPPRALGKRVNCPKCNRAVAVTRENARGVMAKEGDEDAGNAPERPKRMGERLLAAGLVTEAEIEEALSYQRREGTKLADSLIRLGHLKMRDYVDFLTSQPGIVVLDLSAYRVTKAHIHLIPRAMAMRHEAFPIDRLGKLLTVAMACPLDTHAIAEIEGHTGLRVKALFSSPGDVYGAIMEHYPRTAEEMLETGPPRSVPKAAAAPAVVPAGVAGRVGKLAGLPALIYTQKRARELAQRPHATLSDTGALIGEDPAMTATILREANGPAYGFPGQLTSLDEAILLIGRHRATQCVLDAPSFDPAAAGDRFDYKRFWMEAMASASLIEKLHRPFEAIDLDAAYYGALLHDLGRFVLAVAAPEVRITVPREAGEGELRAAEEAHYGVNHADAGAQLARAWGLPEAVTNAIAFHDAPGEAPAHKDVVALVGVASALTRVQSPGDDAFESLLDRCAAILGGLGLAGEEAQTVIDDALDSARTRILWTPMWEALTGASSAVYRFP